MADDSKGRLKGDGIYMDASDPRLALNAFKLSVSEKRDTVTLVVCGPFKAGFGLPNDGDTTRLLFQIDISEQDLFADVERLRRGLAHGLQGEW